MKRPHYAWLVCLGGALTLLSTVGLGVNVFAVYQPGTHPVHCEQSDEDEQTADGGDEGALGVGKVPQGDDLRLVHG